MATINGNSGDNNLQGTNNPDTISGKGGDDTISGRSGGDTLRGDAGGDTVSGDAGRDQLSGGGGNDELDGGDGNDILFGNLGNDTLTGGDGADRFNFVVDVESAAGRDRITDFDEASEFINLGGFAGFIELDTNGDGELTNADDNVSKSGATTVIDVGAAFGFMVNSEVLTVTNSSNSPLDSNDFLFEG